MTFGLLCLALIFSGHAMANGSGDLPQSANTLKLVKSDDNYQILAGIAKDHPQKTTGKLVLQIEPKGEWKMNEGSPVYVDISAPTHAGLKNLKVRRSDLVEKIPHRYRFEIPYQAETKEPCPLMLKFDFVLCTKKLCQKKKFELAYSMLP